MTKKEERKKLEEKIKDLEEKWKRALADYDNLRKRVEKEKEEFIKFATRPVLREILEIYDDLEICQKHLNDQGLGLIFLRFGKFLKEQGVEELEVLGKKFDPQRMEAVEVVDGPENEVMAVVQKGYLFKGELLRPAKVKVGGGEKSQEKKEKVKKIEKEKLRGDYV
ncbi:MAG: nucleotide exchange factor GrpE [Microgenomates group bacterium]